MGNPAARIGDSHACPVTTPVPHIGGNIIGQGIANVLIDGQRAAVLSDACACAGRFNKIFTGSTSVLIGGRPAARKGDLCAHGGKIITGCPTVLIGGTLQDNLEVELSDRTQRILQKEIEMNQAIQDAIELLRKKLKLFKKRDAAMMEEFKKWFGKDDASSIEVISQRIRRELKFIKELNERHFWNIKDEEIRESEFAVIQQCGSMSIIYVGDLFWQAGRYGKDSKAGILIHEISHCNHIGKTADHAYEKSGCLTLASKFPDLALKNADNYEFFIES